MEVHRADFLLSSAFLSSLGVILLNDFVLKPHYPGVVSGKASDFAGMVFFPVALVALMEIASRLTPKPRMATPWWFFAATAVVASALVAVKFSHLGAEAYRSLTMPILAIFNPFALGAEGAIADPWDLLALAMFPVPVLVGIRYRGQGDAAHSSM